MHRLTTYVTCPPQGTFHYSGSRPVQQVLLSSHTSRSKISYFHHLIWPPDQQCAKKHTHSHGFIPCRIWQPMGFVIQHQWSRNGISKLLQRMTNFLIWRARPWRMEWSWTLSCWSCSSLRWISVGGGIFFFHWAGPVVELNHANSQNAMMNV